MNRILAMMIALVGLIGCSCGNGIEGAAFPEDCISFNTPSHIR